MPAIKNHPSCWSAIVATTLLACGGAWSASQKFVPSVLPSQSLPRPANLRDFRFCEVISVFKSGLALHIEVYNTMAYNDCPQERWTQLDAIAMATQYGAAQVKLNGPRHWVLNRLDGSSGTATGRVVIFGGIEMRQVATLEAKLWQASMGDKLYEDNEVRRTTVWYFDKGNRVYELVSPKGVVYMMQSYTTMVDTTLTLAGLDRLGSKLTLPKDWSYRSRVLEQDLALKAEGRAIVIHDNFHNSYQRVLPP